MDTRLLLCFKRVVRTQFIITLVLLMAGFALVNPYAAYGLVYGALLGMFSTWLSYRSIVKATPLLYARPELGLGPVYMGLISRLIVFVAGTVVAIVSINLGIAHVLIGYMAMQLGYIACRKR